MQLTEAVQIDLAAWMTDATRGETNRVAEQVVHRLQGVTGATAFQVSDGLLQWVWREGDGTLITVYPNGARRVRVLQDQVEDEVSTAERRWLLGTRHAAM
jgi:hypothetical protein